MNVPAWLNGLLDKCLLDNNPLIIAKAFKKFNDPNIYKKWLSSKINIEAQHFFKPCYFRKIDRKYRILLKKYSKLSKTSLIRSFMFSKIRKYEEERTHYNPCGFCISCMAVNNNNNVFKLKYCEYVNYKLKEELNERRS